MQFFKLRPDNFPNIRLSQLANVFSKNQQLFSDCIQVKSIKELTKIFDVAVSEYWQTHYTFDKESPKRTKKISAGFIELIMINTIIPLQFAYFKSRNEEVQEILMEMLHEILPEKNVIIDKFQALGLSVKNAFDTQSLLQLKNEYCNLKKCLSCGIGIQLLHAKVDRKNV